MKKENKIVKEKEMTLGTDRPVIQLLSYLSLFPVLVTDQKNFLKRQLHQIDHSLLVAELN